MPISCVIQMRSNFGRICFNFTCCSLCTIFSCLGSHFVGTQADFIGTSLVCLDPVCLSVSFDVIPELGRTGVISRFYPSPFEIRNHRTTDMRWSQKKATLWSEFMSLDDFVSRKNFIPI